MGRTKKNLSYVFLHPARRAAWCWDKVVSLMQGWGRAAYAIDCPGHGSRLQEMRDVTLTDYPKAVVEFIKQRGLSNVVLVGNSTGALICQLTAQEIPERIAHLIWYMAFLFEGRRVHPRRMSARVQRRRQSNEGQPISGSTSFRIRERWMQDMKAEDQTADLRR